MTVRLRRENKIAIFGVAHARVKPKFITPCSVVGKLQMRRIEIGSAHFANLVQDLNTSFFTNTSKRDKKTKTRQNR